MGVPVVTKLFTPQLKYFSPVLFLTGVAKTDNSMV
jgi:hypothetical protein